jgi:cytochrome c-type biogenesis protein CcmI
VLVWIVATLVITAVGLYIAAPLSDPVFNSEGLAVDEDWRRRGHEHALAVQALRELEFDQAMGKLDTNDYHALREKLETRALATMPAQQEESPALSRERAKSASYQSDAGTMPHPRAMLFCSQCGRIVGSTHHFCGNCGAQVTAARGGPHK